MRVGAIWKSMGLAVTALGLIMSTAACDGIACGPGTVQEGEQCVRAPLVKCGFGTKLKFGECVALDVVVVQSDTAGPTPDTTVVDKGLCPKAEAGKYCVSGNIKDFTTFEDAKVKMTILSANVFTLAVPPCSTDLSECSKKCGEDEKCTNPAALAKFSVKNDKGESRDIECGKLFSQCYQGPPAEVNEDGEFILKGQTDFGAGVLALVIADPEQDPKKQQFVTTIAVVDNYDDVGSNNYEKQIVYALKRTQFGAWLTALKIADPTKHAFMLGRVVDKDGKGLDGYAFDDKALKETVHFMKPDFLTFDGTSTSSAGAFFYSQNSLFLIPSGLKIKNGSSEISIPFAGGSPGSAISTATFRMK